MPLRYALASLLFLAPIAVYAQTTGSCEPGQATAELSLSDVRAGVFNTGALFWNLTSDVLYEVPKGSGANPIQNIFLVLGGRVNGETRAAESLYNYSEFWPGPLDDGATLPNAADCSAYDRIFRVSAPELAAYEQTGLPTAALAEWPVGLGAPAVDASGAPVVPTSREQTVDLEAGERPVVYGTETLFSVMNDVGNVHVRSESAPLGVEVRTTAFSVNDPNDAALDQSTFYRYEVVNRSAQTIEGFHVGFHIDHSLGNFSDDYMGSDVSRQMWFGYNSDNDDGEYGTAPPALGVDFLSGGYSTFQIYNSGETNNSYPNNAEEAYNYLSGFWQNGVPLTRGGSGYNPDSTEAVLWSFEGDPVTDAYWSDVNRDGTGQDANGGSGRGRASTPSVDLAPGASHIVDIAVVFARGTSNLNSITALRAASDLVQARYDDGSLYETTSGDIGLPPLAAPVLTSPANGTTFMPPERVVLDWETVADADRYRIEFSDRADFDSPARQVVTAPPAEIDFAVLPQSTFEPIYWRVSPLNSAGAGPTSEARSFTYGFEFTPGATMLSNGQLAFLEVVGPGGANPCGDAASSTFGCDEAGGNAVYVTRDIVTPDANGTGAYALTSLTAGPEESLAAFAPNDFEIRFTAAGSIGYHLFSEANKQTHRVPFEVWDIGLVPLGADGVPAPNDPSDDVQLVPILFSDDATNGVGACAFDLGEVPAAESAIGVPLSDRIYAYYPATTYADFDAVAAPLVDAAPDGCYVPGDDTSVAEAIDFGRGRTIQRIVVADLTGSGSVADLEGAIIRFHTTDPQPVADEAAPTASPLALSVAPNPSRGAARVAFTLPTASAVRVRVVDVLGREVARLADGDHAAGPHTVTLPRGLAAGVYVVTVEAGDVRAARTLTVVR